MPKENQVDFYKQQPITKELIERYRGKCLKLLPPDIVVSIQPIPDDETNPIHLLWMLQQIEEGVTLNHNQSHRWLGWIQCSLFVLGAITVQKERDFTRPIFKG